MKKAIAVCLCCLFLLGLTACGEKKEPSSSAMPVDGRRIGLGNVCHTTMEGTDKTRLRVTAVALLLDKDGRVLDCDLDEVAFTVALAGGKVTPTDPLTTKGEQGDAYQLTKEDVGDATSTGGSWDDQAEAFCDYVEGKMVGDITGLAATDGKSEKIKGCDLILTDIIRAVERAEDAAKTHDMGAEDDLHLALTAAMASASTEAKPQYDVEMAAVALDEGDTITGCMTDSVQLKLSTEEGAFTQMSGEVKSKRLAGDGYGMKEASPIKREWYEQADAFDTFLRGKTAAQVGEMKVDAEGKTDAIAGCTVAVDKSLACVKRAAEKD